MRALVLSFAITFALAGCNTASKPVPDDGTPRREAAGSLSVQPLDSQVQNYYRYSSGLEDSARVVVRGADEWAQLWERIVANHVPKPTAPEIDFTREVLIVAAMGTRPTGGYTIQVRNVTEGDSELVATIVSTSPGPRCGRTMALTSPVDIVRVNRVEVPVRFVEERSVHDCG